MPCIDHIPPGLTVSLFGDEHYFMGEVPCPKETYEQMLGGDGPKPDQKYDWTYDVSFEMMLKHCGIQSDLEKRYNERLQMSQLVFNWAVLLLGLACFLVPGLYYLVILEQSGDKREAAAMLMAKRAYDLERISLQTAGPDKKREGWKEDVIVHHLICAYYQRYVEISNMNNPFTTFFEYRKLNYVDFFISLHKQHYLRKYGWVNNREFAEKVQEKATEAFNRPIHGRTSSLIALAFVLFSVYVLLLTGMSFTGNRVLITVGIVLLIVDVVLTILYLATWVPVTRRVAGMTRGAFERWENGTISDDEIEAVTDLALLAIRYSEAEFRPEARVSEHWWISLVHPSERPSSQKHRSVDVTVKVHSNGDTRTQARGERSGRSGRASSSATENGPPQSRAHSHALPAAHTTQPFPVPHAAYYHPQMHPAYFGPYFGPPQAPPVARNAEAAGWSQAQLQGYMFGRQQQSAHPMQGSEMV